MAGNFEHEGGSTARDDNNRGKGKSRDAFRTISEVAKQLDLPQHVLRFWETKFPQVSPMKRGGGRRYYRPEDVEVLAHIKSLLHDAGYTIKGVQKLLKKPAGSNGPAMETAINSIAELSQSDQPASLTPLNSQTSPGRSVDLGGVSQNQAEQLLSELVSVRDDLKKIS